MNITTMQEKILTAAESLIQTMGYNAFSYKHIAEVVGIKTSSIHYYYPSKDDLAIAVIDWQSARLSVLLAELKSNTVLSLQQTLIALVDIIMTLTLHDNKKMCLGGMLASDVGSLSEKVTMRVRVFFYTLEQWIETVLNENSAPQSSWRTLFSATELSRHLIVQLEGGLLMSRLYDDVAYIETVKQCIKRLV